MKKILKNKAIIWDYALNNINIKKIDNKLWFLSRKLNFGDISGISKKDLQKYLPKLKIDPSLKELLKNYLNASN